MLPESLNDRELHQRLWQSCNVGGIRENGEVGVAAKLSRAVEHARLPAKKRNSKPAHSIALRNLFCPKDAPVDGGRYGAGEIKLHRAVRHKGCPRLDIV